MSKYNRKLIISESEKKEILKQYNIVGFLKEAEIKAGESVQTKITFAGGKYLEISGNFTDITNNITAIKDFCNKVPNGKIIEVVVEAGESQIPNTDNEMKGEKVDVGYLSKKRYSTIKDFLQKKFNEWKISDVNFKKPQKFVETEPKIGVTKWLDNPNGFCLAKDVTAIDPNDKQGYACLLSTFKPSNGKENWVNGKETTYSAIRDTYRTEQFVKVTFRLGVPSNTIINMPPKLECLSGLVIEYNYDSEVEKSNNGTASNVHCCVRGLFTISVNGIKLKRNDGYEFANINNHPQYLDKQKKQPDTRAQNEAGVSNYYINGGAAQPLCVHKSDNGKNQYTSVATYVAKKPMDNYRYNTFKISPQTAKTIVDQAKGTAGLLTINVTANDPNNTHTQAARIIVKDPKGNVYYDSCVGGNCGNRNTGDFQVSYCNTGFS
jgi:hypothetical protein